MHVLPVRTFIVKVIRKRVCCECVCRRRVRAQSVCGSSLITHSAHSVSLCSLRVTLSLCLSCSLFSPSWTWTRPSSFPPSSSPWSPFISLRPSWARSPTPPPPQPGARSPKSATEMTSLRPELWENLSEPRLKPPRGQSLLLRLWRTSEPLRRSRSQRRRSDRYFDQFINK